MLICKIGLHKGQLSRGHFPPNNPVHPSMYRQPTKIIALLSIHPAAQFRSKKEKVQDSLIEPCTFFHSFIWTAHLNNPEISIFC